MPDPRADLGLDALRAHEAGRALSSGQGIARYERLEKLGSGGMAVVYRAIDRKLGREVALKELREELELDAEGLARFRREAEALARLSHPNVVGFYDLVEDEGRELLVMELVRGRPLDKLLATRPERRVLLLLLEKVARCVDHAHEQGIVHRDLKPSNVLVTESGEPKVSDFGLAQLAGARTALTTTGAILGTPSYMAPEQAQGAGPRIDRRTDVYALGVMLYEMLSGKPPFAGDSLPALLNRVLNEDPPPLGPSVHPDLETIALRCLEKEPERRYPTARDVADDLRRFQDGEPIVARRPTTIARAGLWVGRNKKLAAALFALALALAGVGMFVGLRLEEGSARRWAIESELVRAAGVADPTAPFDPEAVDRIVKAAGPETSLRLGKALDEVTDELEAATYAVYLQASEPDADEKAGGALPIAGIKAALDQCLDPDRDSMDAPSTLLLLAAVKRLEDREARARPGGPEPDVRRMIAAEQDRRVRAGKRRVARLACESLARLAVAQGAVRPLSRYIGVVEDELAAAYAGEALARIGGAQAEEILMRARTRFDHNGIFWLKVQPAIQRAGDPTLGATHKDGYVEQGIRLAEKGDLEGAIAALTSAIKADARDAHAFYNRGMTRYKLHDSDGALLDLTRAIELAPDRDPHFYSTRGVVRKDRGDLDGSIADLDSAIAMDPQQAAFWVNRGNTRRAKGDVAGSIADLTSAIALDPQNTSAWNSRGLAKKSKRDREGAMADFTRAIEIDPRCVAALGNRGGIFLERRDFPRAIADFSQSLEIDPDYFEAYFNRGLARMRNGDPDAAIGDFTRALELRPKLALPLWQRGIARKDSQDFAGAIADLSSAVALDPQPAKILNDLGVVRRMAGDLAGSLRDLDRAVELAPLVPNVWLNRGTTLSFMGEPKKAIADLTQAIELDERLSDAWVNRGVIRGDQGDHEGALSDLGKAIELAPRDTAAWANRAKERALLGDRAGAIADYTRQLEIVPRDVRSLVGRGLLRTEAGEKAGAIADLERALEIDPTGKGSAEARRALGELRGR